MSLTKTIDKILETEKKAMQGCDYGDRKCRGERLNAQHELRLFTITHIKQFALALREAQDILGRGDAEHSGYMLEEWAEKWDREFKEP